MVWGRVGDDKGLHFLKILIEMQYTYTWSAWIQSVQDNDVLENEHTRALK